MKQLTINDECRTVQIKSNRIDKLLTIQEELDNEIMVVTLTFNEARMLFNLLADSLSKAAM
jgi:hypothetical protein